MARGKPIRNSFYTESQGVKNIAMPPLPDEAQSENQSDNAIGVVPDQIPKEVYEEMNQNQESSTQETSSQEQETQESSTQEQETNHEEQEQSPTQESSTQESSTQENSSQEEEDSRKKAAESFRSVREAKEKAERERDFLMQQMLDHQQKKGKSQEQEKKPEPPPVDDDINFEIDEDGLVEGRYVKKVTNKIRNLEKQLKNYETQSQQQSTEAKIKEKFPDFDKVVSSENVEMLNSQFPEVAQSLRESSDLYSKAVSAYNVMKRFGIHRDNPQSEERVKALKNTQKPKPLASVSPQQGDTPLSKANAFANGLTEELKDQLRKEMAQARRNH